MSAGLHGASVAFALALVAASAFSNGTGAQEGGASTGASVIALPPLLPEADEIALALTAAPAQLSAASTVWVLRRGGYVRVREGTNGFTCYVGRDHPESLYPICFDAEASQTILRAALRERALLERGRSVEEAATEVALAYASGALRPPARPAMAYMMSPRQVIYSSARGRRVGSWHPHLMLYMPYATRDQLGLADRMLGSQLSIDDEGSPTAHMVIVLPAWSTGEAAAP